jgi:hypothetical protein
MIRSLVSGMASAASPALSVVSSFQAVAACRQAAHALAAAAEAMPSVRGALGGSAVSWLARSARVVSSSSPTSAMIAFARAHQRNDSTDTSGDQAACSGCHRAGTSCTGRPAGTPMGCPR